MSKLNFKLVVVLVAVVSLFSILIIRLFDLQIIRGNYFRNLSDDNRFFSFDLPAERGVFLDRYGIPLSINRRDYYLIDDYKVLFSPQTPISRDEALVQIASQSAQVGYSLKRSYPFNEVGAHFIGYTGSVTKEDLLNDDTLDITDQLGKMGLEKVFNYQLQGEKGNETYEINTHGVKQRLIVERKAIIGKSINTTIDSYLLKKAQEVMDGQNGSIVIADADSGEILALASNPSFNANYLNRKYRNDELERERKNEVNQYFSDPRKPFFNRVTSGTYPPGSIFKIVTALAGLETESITEQTTIIDKGFLEVGDYRYKNWFYTQSGGAEGEIGVVRAITRSNDTYFYKAAEFTGSETIAEYARLFGFGKPTGIEIIGESSGLVPDPAWKERVKGERWFLGNTYHYGIGQGDLLVTPMQITQLVQSVANRGELCQSTLVTDSKGRCRNLGFNQENINLVLKGMVGACSTGGTASVFYPYNQKVAERLSTEENNDINWQIEQGLVACKTGTAEFGGADEKGNRKTHGWFVAIVGLNNELNLNGVENDDEEISEDLQALIDAMSDEATESAGLAEEEIDENISDHDLWLQHIGEKGLPKKLVFVAMVESDDDDPFKSGSTDAAPLVKEIIDWMRGNKSVLQNH